MDKLILTLFALSAPAIYASSPIDRLAARVTEGTADGRIHFRQIDAPEGRDTFCISATPDGRGVEICGNSTVSMAAGFNRYLRDVAGIHICWNNLTQPLPDVLPIPSETIAASTDLTDRYYLNYCTLSYTMAFWDLERWEKEIDWMALHGVNMCLAGMGMEPVWRNVLLKLGYSDDEVGEFVSGAGYRAWWLMNNLEGWGGPVTPEWYEDTYRLQTGINARMRELGIEPVLPGYAGMIPHNAGEKIGINVADPGLWCGFVRPAFIIPGDEAFDRIADIYYKELTELYGLSRYYSMDPFHEGGSTKGVDMTAAGKAVYDAMKRANPDAVWVAQAWQANPHRDILDAVPHGGIKLLDLYAEKKPQWGEPNSAYYREGGFRGHDWLYCMLLNFGGNVGMHGRMDGIINGFAKALVEANSPMTGVGVTAEGIENNPVMYELLYDLPWRDDISRDSWLRSYIRARYGHEPTDGELEAWEILATTVYATPLDYKGEGTPESLLCARPAKHLKSVSTWGGASTFYSYEDIDRAASLLEESAATSDNVNVVYDMIDVRRQANATLAHDMLPQIDSLFEAADTLGARRLTGRFMQLLSEQDGLLAGQPSMCVDTWLDMAAACGSTREQRVQNVENAARLITVWGDSIAANKGGLHDYSHREWSGLLGTLYRDRWDAWWRWRLDGERGPAPDFWAMEEKWVNDVVDRYRKKISEE